MFYVLAMTEQLKRIADTLGVDKIQRHIFLCCDQTKPKCSDKEVSLVSCEFLKRRLEELKLTGAGGVYRTKANCLRICEGGPIAVVYPEGTWYQGMTAERIPLFVQQHLIEGKPVEEWIFARNQLPNEEVPEAQVNETAR